MAKRRNRRRRGRQQRAHQNLWFQFKAQSLSQTVHDEEEREEYKRKQKEHLQKIVNLEQDLLSRTVLVSSVKDLNQVTNRDNLKILMQQKYGRVERCDIDKKSNKRGKFPIGRVRFHYKKDAEKIFGGKTLLEAQKEKNAQVKIPCRVVGYRGNICIRPSFKYAGMVHDESHSSKTISVNTDKLSFGHWFPQGKDASTHVLGLENLCNENDTSAWVEEESTGMNPIVSFHLEKAVVELDVTHCLRNSANSSATVDDSANALADLLRMMMNESEQIVLSFRFKDLAHPMELCQQQDENGDHFSIVFSLKHPPRLISISVDHNGYETRTRLTNIGDLRSETIGSCLGYKLQVSTTEVDRLLMNTKAFGKLKSFGLFSKELYSRQDAEQIRTEHVVVAEKQNLVAKLELPPTHIGLLLQSVLDNHSCSWFDMLKDKVRNHNDIFDLVQQGEPVIVEKVLVEIRGMHGKTRYPAHVFEALCLAGMEVDDIIPRAIPDFCVDLPRILITPSRIAVTAFEVEVSNRFVRKFIHNYNFSREAFIRVTIGEENGDKLFSDYLSASVAARIKALVLDGFNLAGKTYRFLAYSSSQLKELSVWMVCPECGWSAKRMRESMGDFSMCTTPPKYAARVGQCFSTTFDTVGPRVNGVTGDLRVKDDLPDITTYNRATGAMMEHSDGVGLIRKEVLEDLMFRFPIGGPKNPCDVSAIQIRYGGAKGVLMAWDFDSLNDPRCRGYDVCLRPSMVKFRAPYDRLEVVTRANHIPYYLNRNVILLGSHHRIPDRTFLDMQAEMLTKLNRILVDADCAAAFLPRLGLDGGLMSTLDHMLCIGLEPSADPFLYSCLHAIRAYNLMNLREKSRIHVEKGAVLIGGIDELGLVPEGHVYVQVRRPQRGVHGGNENFTPVVGQVLVGKHPMNHPGDLRMLKAIDVPELRDKKNVILFSRHGDRPEADKMSGSDLDGDQFAVTWDDRLFLRTTSPPMDYTPPAKLSESSGISDSSLIEHFIKHAQNDNLGRISMLWLDYASIRKDAGCKECMDLAKLHSIAVDFPKTGIPAKLPDELKLPARIPRAHWREKKGSPSFHCESIVGQLYDQVVIEMQKRKTTRKACKAMAGRCFDKKNGQILMLGEATHLFESKKGIYEPLLPRRLGWTTDDDLDGMLLEFANDQRLQYESQLTSLMNQYKLKCEGEVVSGCILKYHKLHKVRRHDICEAVRRQFRMICNENRSVFFSAVYHLANNNIGFLDVAAVSVDGVDESEAAGDGATIEEVNAEDLDRIEAVATSLNGARTPADRAARDYARRLAAAYYIASYSPEMHQTGIKTVLYSFPWVLAADVIACAMVE